MNSRWLSIGLRIVAAILIAIGAVRFLFSLSFHTEEQTTATGASIDHVVGFGPIPLVLPLMGLALLALSFMISRKRA